MSTCLVPKPYPGSSGSASLRYDSYTMSNCSSQTACVTARLTQNSGTGAALFLSAYSPAYDPANVATNYAADAGSSGPLGIPQPLSFNVAGGSTFVIVVNEVNANGGSGASYTLSVDGVCLPCAAYTGTGNCCDTPPSATITAPAGACAGLSGAAASVPDAGAGADLRLDHRQRHDQLRGRNPRHFLHAGPVGKRRARRDRDQGRGLREPPERRPWRSRRPRPANRRPRPSPSIPRAPAAPTATASWSRARRSSFLPPGRTSPDRWR